MRNIPGIFPWWRTYNSNNKTSSTDRELINRAPQARFLAYLNNEWVCSTRTSVYPLLTDGFCFRRKSKGGDSRGGFCGSAKCWRRHWKDLKVHVTINRPNNIYSSLQCKHYLSMYIFGRWGGGYTEGAR